MHTKMADAKKHEMKNQRSEQSCYQRFKESLSLVPRGATPPDWGTLGLIFISLFSSSFTLTFLFPFLPEMILTFGYREEEKGTYVGLVASSVFAGRAVGSFFWGWLSDLKGRRLVLLLTIFFNGLFSFLFGFSDSLVFAMVIRFLAGLSNGTVGVAKTILYDVSDNTNQAFSMSIISISWGSGLILGPTVGGYLALPAAKYPDVFSAQGFFAEFPFVLPSSCCLIVCGIVFLVIFFKFEEPKLVLNMEVELKPASEHDGIVELAPGTPMLVSRSQGTLASRTWLDRLGGGSLASLHTPRAHMSMETLHCETELSYYFAQLRSQAAHSTRSSVDNVVSKSMHNLTGPAAPLISEEDDVLPVTRKRSLSQGHRTSQDNTVDGFSLNWKANHVSPQNVSSGENGPGSLDAADSERKTSAPDEKDQAHGKLAHERSAATAGNGGVVVNMREEEAEEAGTSCKKKKKRCSLSACWNSLRDSSLMQLLRLGDVRHSVALYTVMSFAVIGYEDVFTIFASTPKDYDGLGFSTDEIGLALGAVSIPLMLIQIKLYPVLVSMCGIRRAYLINIFFIFIPIQLVPFLHWLADNKVQLWVGLVILTLPMRVAVNSCFTGSSLLINNSVTSDFAGKVNGLAMTCTAIARTLAPTVGGAMFSWSLKMNRRVGPPLDISLTFVFLGFVMFISALQCLFMPRHLDHQKK